MGFFGNLMNNYYYGKAGQGDYKVSDLPHTRWQLFWEMLKVRLSGLIRLNLMYFVAWIPAAIGIAIGVLSALGVLGNATEETIQSGQAANELYSLGFFTALLLFPAVGITGPFTAGISYVTRNWSRDEHAFIWTDFKDAIKENWKQSLPVSLITGVLPLLVLVSYTFYGDMAATQPFMIIPQVLVVMIAVLWSLAVTYMHPMIVSYRMRFRDVLRNAFLLAVARLPMSVGIRLLHTLPLAVVIAIAFFTNNYMWALLGLAGWYILLGFGLSRFVTASYTNAVFDKYINSRIEGAVVDRGLAKDTDDDDDWDGEEPGEQDQAE